MEAEAWYAANNCDHAHCPHDCELMVENLLGAVKDEAALHAATQIHDCYYLSNMKETQRKAAVQVIVLEAINKVLKSISSG